MAPVLWRIHRTTGPHVGHWSELRTYGPLPSMRYDPHPEPRAYDGPSGEGVLYAAADLPEHAAGATSGAGLATALAEVFQDRRRIDTISGTPYATSWRPDRPLRLLDLSGPWALRNHAAFVLSTGRKDVARTWARAIRRTWPELDGLWSVSTLTGGPNITLWKPAADSFPAAPDFSRPLRHAVLIDVIAAIAMNELSYGILR